MTSGRKGSDYEPHLDTAVRLTRWRRLASEGVPVNDIAHALGITRAALDASICRARKRGHPDAVLHPSARIAGSGTWHLTDAAARRRARRTTDRSSR